MLRVFLSDAADADRAVPWVRYAPDGRILAQGSDAPARWPADPRIDVVLAAERVRLIALTLPPLRGDRLAIVAGAPTLAGTLLIIDGRAGSRRRVRVRPRPGCEAHLREVA